MRFDLRAKSSDMLTPVYEFPGDEAISQDSYKKVIYGGFVSSTATLYGAARAVGLTVDAETFERWKRVAATAGLLDDFLDESPDPAKSQSLYDQGLADQTSKLNMNLLPAYADERLVPALNLMKTSIDVLPPERQQRMITAARDIGRIALAKSSANNIGTYTELLRLEAKDSSDLIRFSASDEMYNRPDFEAFALWCENALTLAVLYDHGRDLKQDYNNGNTSVEPTLKNRLNLYMEATSPLFRLLKNYSNRHASRAAIAARLKYSPRPTKRIFSRQKLAESRDKHL